MRANDRVSVFETWHLLGCLVRLCINQDVRELGGNRSRHNIYGTDHRPRRRPTLLRNDGELTGTLAVHGACCVGQDAKTLSRLGPPKLL